MAIHHSSIIQSTASTNQQHQPNLQPQSSQQFQEQSIPFNQQVSKPQPQFEDQVEKPQPFGPHDQIQELFESPDQLPELSQPMLKDHEEVFQDLLDSIPHEGKNENFLSH